MIYNDFHAANTVIGRQQPWIFHRPCFALICPSRRPNTFSQAIRSSRLGDSSGRSALLRSVYRRHIHIRGTRRYAGSETEANASSSFGQSGVYAGTFGSK